ncbi:putative phage abortive infection protein [Chryseobacterium sp. T20]|uniref:putative phage abortive infection protein n=1 Tax=Chryseobacterium sp. T20 TaxID=3395375 RepID=UPI0039BCA6ED
MSNIINQPDEKEAFFSEKTGKILSIFGLTTIGITIILYVLFGSWYFEWYFDEAIMGQFGDFIGGFIGSLFSLAGVILFYVALKEQRKDININQQNLGLQTDALEQQVIEFKNQKEELIETRKVYEEQTKLIMEQTNLYKLQNREMKEQSGIAKAQQFDTSFFSYLSIFNELKNSLNHLIPSKNYFGMLTGKLKGIQLDEDSIGESINIICEKYLEVYNENKDKLSPYFKTLYRLMVLVDSANIDEYKKNEYFKLIRSQLSDDELLVLYYNYHTSLGMKVRSYVIKYGLFKHLNTLDKFEFECELVGIKRYKLEQFLKNNEHIIVDGLKNFASIESSTDIFKSITYELLGLNIEVKLEISNNFKFSLIFDLNDFNNHSDITKELIKKIISRHLYAILYFSKFQTPTESELNISVIETDQRIEFLFIVENLQNL